MNNFSLFILARLSFKADRAFALANLQTSVPGLRAADLEPLITRGWVHKRPSPNAPPGSNRAAYIITDAGVAALRRATDFLDTLPSS